jgi:membrane protease YdiL (CAAX protease family)
MEPEVLILPPPKPERDPFWGYGDLLGFAGMVLPCFLIAFLALPKLARFDPQAHPWQLVPEQTIFYALLTGVLGAMFRLQYSRPLWRSLGWVPYRVSTSWLVIAGIAAAIAVSGIGVLIKVPITENPMTKLLKDPASLIPLAIFGVTIGPLCEELFFRGFVQPLLVRTLGALAGIVVTNVPFGILHYWEYGRSWRHVVVITLAGTAFGWMRHATGSTRASALMHGAYNSLFFYALFASKGHL